MQHGGGPSIVSAGMCTIEGDTGTIEGDAGTLLRMSLLIAFVPFFFFFHTHLRSSFWTSRGHRCRPFFPPSSCLQFLSRIEFSNPHCSSIFHRVLLTHALALSASQFVRKKKSPQIYTSMHSGGFKLTKLT